MTRWHDPPPGRGSDGESRQRKPPTRYWLHKGTSGYVTFLDGEERTGPFLLKEHVVKAPAESTQKYVEITCRQQGGAPCPRDANDSPRIVEVLTVLKHYRDNENKPRLYKQLFVMSATATKEYFRRQITKRHGLRGCMFEMIRSDGQRSAAVGDAYDFERKFTDEEMVERFGKILKTFLTHVSVEEYLKPYRYADVFAIPTVEEIEAVTGRRGRGAAADAPHGAATDRHDPGLDDDIPF